MDSDTIYYVPVPTYIIYRHYLNLEGSRGMKLLYYFSIFQEYLYLLPFTEYELNSLREVHFFKSQKFPFFYSFPIRAL